MGKTVRAIALVAALALPIASTAPAEASTPKRGQFCKKADAGKRRAGLVCTKDGSRHRWR